MTDNAKTVLAQCRETRDRYGAELRLTSSTTPEWELWHDLDLAVDALAASEARVEALEGQNDGLMVVKAWYDDAERWLDDRGVPSEEHTFVEGEPATRLLSLADRLAALRGAGEVKHD
jgi:hypothetical protein